MEKPKKSFFQGWACDRRVTRSWLEQRKQKKRESDNVEFSQNLIKQWEYKRTGSLAKKVCYEGMLPYTRIMVGARRWFERRAGRL